VVYGYSVPLADGRGVDVPAMPRLSIRTPCDRAGQEGELWDPTLYGQRVLALTYFSRHAAPNGASLAVRIAHAGRARAVTATRSVRS